MREILVELCLVLTVEIRTVGRTFDGRDSLYDAGDVETSLITATQPSKPQALLLYRSASVVHEDVQVAQPLRIP